MSPLPRSGDAALVPRRRARPEGQRERRGDGVPAVAGRRRLSAGRQWTRHDIVREPPARRGHRPPHRRRGRGGRDRAPSRGLDRLRAVLGARLHRLPAVLHPLHPQRQPRLDRGDRPLRADVAGLHRRRRGDAQEHAHRGRAAVERHAAGPGAQRASRRCRLRHARLPRPARLFLGDDRRAHAATSA